MPKQYNFRAARQRIKQLKNYYRRLAKQQPNDGTWDWWIMAEIDELEREIAEEKERLRGPLSDQDVVEIAEYAQERWPSNGLGRLTVQEMMEFEEWLEEKRSALIR